MSAAYCSYCDAETLAGFGGVCGLCGNRQARGDRLIIDDPHATMTPGEVSAMSERVRDFLATSPALDVKPVIIMARLHDGPQPDGYPDE